MLAVLGLDERDVLGAVGGEREVLPVGEQFALGAQRPDAPHDQPPATEGRLGDLRLARVGVVGDRRPGVLGDLLDECPDARGQAHPDRVGPAGLLEAREHLGVPEPGVRAQQLGAGRAGPRDAGDQLVAEAQDPALRVGRPVAQPQVQHLAGLGPAGEDRVVAALARVAERGALLGVAVDLADEAVDVDDQAL